LGNKVYSTISCKLTVKKQLEQAILLYGIYQKKPTFYPNLQKKSLTLRLHQNVFTNPLSMSASRGKKAYNKGLQLEKDFAIWMRKKLGYTRVMPRQFVYGKIAARPYEVDIFGIKERPLFKLLEFIGVLLVLLSIAMLLGEMSGLQARLETLLSKTNIKFTGAVLFIVGTMGLIIGYLGSHKQSTYSWVECKNLNTNVKRDHIFKLKSSVKDVRNERKSKKWHPNTVIMVSGSGFDSDALHFARAHKMICYKQVGKRFIRVN